MIDAKKAALYAAQNLKDVYGAGPFREPKDIRLEEIVRDDVARIWCITLSFVHDLEPEDMTSTAAAIANLALAPRHAVTARLYKTFEVSMATGEVRAMKIRNPDARD